MPLLHEESQSACNLWQEYFWGPSMSRTGMSNMGLALPQFNTKPDCSHSVPVHMQPRCPQWTDRGECNANPGYMLSTCRLSCKSCTPLHSPGETGALAPRSGPFTKTLRGGSKTIATTKPTSGRHYNRVGGTGKLGPRNPGVGSEAAAELAAVAVDMAGSKLLDPGQRASAQALKVGAVGSKLLDPGQRASARAMGLELAVRGRPGMQEADSMAEGAVEMAGQHSGAVSAGSGGAAASDSKQTDSTHTGLFSHFPVR